LPPRAGAASGLRGEAAEMSVTMERKFV